MAVESAMEKANAPPGPPCPLSRSVTWQESLRLSSDWFSSLELMIALLRNAATIILNRLRAQEHVMRHHIDSGLFEPRVITATITAHFTMLT